MQTEKRFVSEETRAKLSEAAKRRWAELRDNGKENSPNLSGQVGGLTPEGRERLAELMRERHRKRREAKEAEKARAAALAEASELVPLKTIYEAARMLVDDEKLKTEILNLTTTELLVAAVVDYVASEMAGKVILKRIRQMFENQIMEALGYTI